ncbi:uncharacterized protein [Dysidea avara]|uniref:uncharacterized protein n=1 Tax=Dysidea avara TaxID=196820 RepID=UPI003323B6E7
MNVNVPVPVSLVQQQHQQSSVYSLDEHNRLRVSAANSTLAQREVAEPTNEEFKSAFNIMPRILQLLTSASHGQGHAQNFLELRTELQRCKYLLDLIPGLDSSLAQQNDTVRTTKNMISKQNKLLRQYKELDVFKASDSDTSSK